MKLPVAPRWFVLDARGGDAVTVGAGEASSGVQPGAARPLRVVATALGLYAIVIALLVYVLGYSGIWYGFHDNSDVGLYFQYAGEMARGRRPYVDFLLEYPPLAVPWFAWPGHTDDLVGYRLFFNVQMFTVLAVAALLTAVAGAHLWPGRRAQWVAVAFAAAVAANGAISANRYDATVALVLAGMFAAVAVRSWPAAAMLVGAGFALKIVPAILLPLVLVLAGRARAIAWCGLAFSVAAFTPFVPLVTHGAAGLEHLVRYHLERPLQVESSLATALMIGHLAGWGPLEIRNGYGGQVIAGSARLATLSGILGLVALAATYAVIWWRREVLRRTPQLVPIAAVAVLLAFVTFAKVLSPQYLVWLLPAAALVAPEHRGLAAALLLTMLLTQIEFPGRYPDLVSLRTGTVLLVTARNGLLAVAFLASLLALARPRRTFMSPQRRRSLDPRPNST